MKHPTPHNHTAKRDVLCIFLLLMLGIALGGGAAGVASASPNFKQQATSQDPKSKVQNPTSGGMGMPTSGYVTTLFAEPISYENSGYYYDGDNQLQFASYVFHHGIDVSGGCTAGVYPVYAATEGTVAVAQYISDGYGTQVVIDNGYNVGGNGKYTYTFYSHMGSRTTGTRYLMVSPGQYVQAGQLVGYQGNDGSAFGSCGPDGGTHLDWEIRLSSTALTYGTSMRYNGTAASPNYYTFQQVSYSDLYPNTRVDSGPFGGAQPTTPPQPTNTPRPAATRVPPTQAPPTPLPTQTPGPCGMSFPDVQDSYWAYPYISYLYCRNVVGGFGDGAFHPTAGTTRGQFTKMLVLGSGWNLYNPYFASFSDVPSGSTFYQYIETAHLRDVISGYEDGTFRPNNSINRAQTAKMIVLAKGWQPSSSGSSRFSDVPSGYWAYGYIETAYNKGIIGGYPDGTFHPEVEVNRAQLSKMLSLAMGQ